MEPKGSLPHSHEPATCPCSEPHQYSPSPTIPLLGDQFQYYSTICAWVLQVVSFPQDSPPEHCMRHSSPPYKLHAPAQLILDLITQIIFGEEFRSFSSSLCSLFHSPVTLVLLRPKYPSWNPTLKHSQPMFLPQCK